MNNTHALAGDKKTKTVETDRLHIKGHLLKWDDVVIQISNISMITAAKLPFPRFPILVWIVASLGAGVTIAASSLRSSYYMYYYETAIYALLILGVVLMGAAVIWVLRWLMDCFKVMGHKYLNILLSSGDTYALYIQDQNFLQQVLQVFSNIFESGTNAGTNYYIDVSGGTINGNVGHIQQR